MALVTRRTFLREAAAVSCAAMAAGSAKAWAQPAATPPLCIFSKHLQFITDWGKLADTYAELGLDGVDLTVRPGGHIEPAAAATELPKAVKAIEARGLRVLMITSVLQRGDDPNARPTLEAAAASGIRYFRCGTGKYEKTGPILEQLDAYQRGLASLAALADETDTVGGYHNHSGPGYIGGPLWDLHRLIQGIGSEHLGSNFDVGHATAEGANGAGLTNARLLAPYVHMTAIKDFRWSDEGRVTWCPLAKGIVPTISYFQILRDAGFTGPVSIHFEYKTKDDEELLRHMADAVNVARAALVEAGYTA